MNFETAGTVKGVSKIPTFSGRNVDPLNLWPEDIDIFDIAHALSRIARFTGHTDGEFAFSVAQHSCIVSDQLPDELKLWGLLHDASEAYLNDVSRPLKYSPAFKGYHAIEKQAMAAIVAKFKLSPDNEPEAVKQADVVSLSTEFRDLMTKFTQTEYWEQVKPRMPKPLPFTIVPWAPQQAEFEFLSRYARINKVSR